MKDQGGRVGSAGGQGESDEGTLRWELGGGARPPTGFAHTALRLNCTNAKCTWYYSRSNTDWMELCAVNECRCVPMYIHVR
jgi:hypothetical protein